MRWRILFLQSLLGQKSLEPASSSFEPHTLHSVGNSTGLRPSRFSSTTTLSILGMISPRLTTTTWLPIWTPRARSVSGFARLARWTVVPASSTGSKIATGVYVEPDSLHSISLTTEIASSSENLNAIWWSGRFRFASSKLITRSLITRPSMSYSIPFRISMTLDL